MNLLENIDALLITNPINIRYLTGFMGLAPEEREGYVLVTQNKMYLFTNALYVEQARRLVNEEFKMKNVKLEIVEVSRENPLSQQMIKMLSSVIPASAQGRSAFGGKAGIQRQKDWIPGQDGYRTVTRQARNDNKVNLGFEETDVTYAEFKKLEQELDGVTLIPIQNRVEELRKCKQPDEIKSIRRAAELTDICFGFVLKKIKQGVTESEIAWEIESYFKKNGAGNAFPPIVAFNENSSQPHYSPYANCQLQTNSLILLDFGARVSGYCADMTRVVFWGSPTEEQKKVYETVLAANEAAMKVLKVHNSPSPSLILREGNARFFSGAALDHAAREVIEKAGFPTYPHSLGHNLGLDIHEGPRLSIKHDEELKPGMVFTIEPGIYLEGKFGIRIEDLVVLKEDGMEILSRSPKEIIVLNV